MIWARLVKAARGNLQEKAAEDSDFDFSFLEAGLKKDYDPFLKLTLAKALTELNNRAGYKALVEVLKNDDAGLARAQALDTLCRALEP